VIGVEGVSEQSLTTSKKFVMTYLRHFMEICNMEFGFFGNGFITVLMATENRSKSLVSQGFPVLLHRYRLTTGVPTKSSSAPPSSCMSGNFIVISARHYRLTGFGPTITR